MTDLSWKNDKYESERYLRCCSKSAIGPNCGRSVVDDLEAGALSVEAVIIAYDDGTICSSASEGRSWRVHQ